MRTYKIITGLLLSILILQSCSHKAYESVKKTKSPPVIDGVLTEHPDSFIYDEKTGCYYLLSNDASDLYICLRWHDRARQIKLIRSGMEVWLDTLPRNTHRMGVLYPLAQQPEQRERQGGPSGEAIGKKDRNQMLSSMLSKQLLVELKGIPGSMDGSYPLETGKGVRVKMTFDSLGYLNYELAIPLTSIYGNTYKPGDSRALNFELVINGMQFPQQPPGEPPHDFNGGGGGFAPGGGMPGGGGPPMGGMDRPDFSELTERNTFSKMFLTQSVR